MAALIEKTFKEADVELEKSSGGAYEIFKDGKQIFSKLDEGRFPGDDEVIRMLKE